MKKYLSFVVLALVVAALVAPTLAQDMPAPQITVNDQLSLNSRVDVAAIYSEGAGFVVIHNADGPGIGQAPVAVGWTYNLRIPIDASQATPVLSAMLHVDDNELGVYEFGTVEGADGPVVIDGAPINPTFNVNMIAAADQFVQDNTVTIGAVVTPVDGWLVVHSGDATSFGGVLGQTQVSAGTNTGVVVELAAEGRTDIVWPMLHVDDGTAGDYEFDGQSGFDNPVVVNGQVASAALWTVAHVRALDQIVMHGDGMDMGATPTVTILTALCEAECFVVVHQEADGSFGGVAGVSEPLAAGLHRNIVIEIDSAMLTPRLWPMLHVDDGAAGTYEFDGQSGLDNPVSAMGEVVTFPMNAAPAMVFPGEQALGEGDTVFIRTAIIDATGWLVIHAADGAVLGEPVLLHAGANWNIRIAVDPAAAADQVSPMLHYDTGEAGVYEFGAVEGADLPTSVAGNVIVAPLSITAE